MVTSTSQLGVTTTGALARDAQKLKSIFETVDAASCPREYNFHMHTVCSDGQLTPTALIEQAIDLGLKEFAITDHHTVAGYYQARQELEDWRWRHPARVRRGPSGVVSGALPRLWTGVEITTKLANTDVHILGYAFDPVHDVIQPYLQGGSPQGADQQAAAVIAAIQGAGGLAVLAHPARYRRPAEELVPAAVAHGIDGIETYYAYENPSEWRPCPKKTPLVRQLAEQFQIFSTCGTDTHGKVLTRRI
ncbi:PHP domain-containing protein [Leptolyngbya sp. PCC 6406]|uniref:PHP domain-containing protein n=1 Tax=Leptolyngbya sp. PCC 6406 TaxID=1173264 RepID=UPI0002ABA962|nr:PHP domain-containing protein [Leptolyngbya sp. PCC 6406]